MVYKITKSIIRLFSTISFLRWQTLTEKHVDSQELQVEFHKKVGFGFAGFLLTKKTSSGSSLSTILQSIANSTENYFEGHLSANEFSYLKIILH